MNFKRVFNFLVLIFCSFALFAEISVTDDSRNLKQKNFDDFGATTKTLSSEKINIFEEKKTKITIKTNVEKCEIYLNGQFEGNSPLTILDLPEGRYRLRVEKKGYQPRRYFINVRSGQEENFYVELQQVVGYVTFEKSPQNASVYVDGSLATDKIIELSQGEHKVKVRAFGFVEESATIFVLRNTLQIVSAKLEPAKFEISDFKVNKQKFNPNLPGYVGKIDFNFNVTNNSPTTLAIFDEDGALVFDAQLKNFTTWHQTFTWNGILSSGQIAKNGVYKAELSGSDKTCVLNFQIDDSIKLPTLAMSPSGTGIGDFPVAFKIPQDTFALNFSSGAIFKSEEKNFVASPFEVGLSYSIFDFMEFFVKGRLFVDNGGENLKCTPNFTTGAKFVFSSQFENFALNYGFLGRVGFVSKKSTLPAIFDLGTGAGGGFIFGAEISKLFVGASSQMLYGVNGFFAENKIHALKNGVCVQYDAGAVVPSIFGAVNSNFGSDADNKTFWQNGIEAGVDVIFKPKQSNYSINLCTTILFFDKKSYFKSNIGITILL